MFSDVWWLLQIYQNDGNEVDVFVRLQIKKMNVCLVYGYLMHHSLVSWAHVYDGFWMGGWVEF